MISAKVLLYTGGAALAGGLARFMARGSYKTQLFIQDIMGASVGWCAVVTATVIYPKLLDEPWVFGATCFLSAYITPALLTFVFSRMDGLDVNINVGAIEINSQGKKENINE
jgi:hypothetical protein